MKIGDIINGNRIVTGFTIVEGRECPNTSPYTATEVVEEVIEEPTKVEKAEFICQYCGKVCGSMLGLSAHERACDKNPQSKNYKE